MAWLDWRHLLHGALRLSLASERLTVGICSGACMLMCDIITKLRAVRHLVMARGQTRLAAALFPIAVTVCTDSDLQ